MYKPNNKVTNNKKNKNGRLVVTNMQNYFNVMNYFDREDCYHNDSDEDGNIVWTDKKSKRVVAKRYTDENGDMVYRVNSKILECVKNNHKKGKK